MKVVLGIDAAWTRHNPSGVAVAINESGRWRLAAVAQSYQSFYALADPEHKPATGPTNESPDTKKLLHSVKAICAHSVDLIAVDMPMAQTPITQRRISDTMISKTFGGRKCATHSPSAQRPGRISDDLRKSFGEAGYDLQTGQIVKQGLIEVYPHPALLELMSAAERLPYKAGKTLTYWPNSPILERRKLLLEQWNRITAQLNKHILGVVDALPLPTIGASTISLKAFEDSLDAVICAWVAICVLEGNSDAYGDHNSAIWVPNLSRAERQSAQ
jgi:predicted RNase H-like nuclease